MKGNVTENKSYKVKLLTRGWWVKRGQKFSIRSLWMTLYINSSCPFIMLSGISQEGRAQSNQAVKSTIFCTRYIAKTPFFSANFPRLLKKLSMLLPTTDFFITKYTWSIAKKSWLSELNCNFFQTFFWIGHYVRLTHHVYRKWGLKIVKG